MSLIRVAEVGRLVAPIELRFAASGTAIAKLRLVFDKSRRNETTNEWETQGEFWVDAVAFGQFGENLANANLPNGANIFVIGDLTERKYERRDGGEGIAKEIRMFDGGPSLRNATVSGYQKSSGGGGTSGGQFGGQGFGNAPQGGGFGSGDPFAASYSDSSELPPF